MGFRFQRRLTLFPGVRLNFSRNGISTSIGPRGASITLGKGGVWANVGVPGTGLYYREKLTPGDHEHAGNAPQPLAMPPPAPAGTPVASAPVSEVTSEGLGELKKLVMRAVEEREGLRRVIPETQRQLEKAKARLRRAQNWFFKLFIGKKVPQRAATVEAKEAELKTQEAHLAGAVIDTEFTLDAPTVAAFGTLTETFEQLAACQTIWDVTREQFANRRVTRASAERSVERKPVRFDVAEDAVLQSDAKVLRMRNANGADMLIYPGFLMMSSGADLALVELRDIELRFNSIRFTENEAVPSDSKVVDHTWAKCNKDGSPDRRFKGNYQIPVAAYGQLLLNSPSGMNEEYLVSNLETAARFAEAYSDYKRALRVLASKGPPAPAHAEPPKALESKEPPPAERPAAPAEPAAPPHEWKSIPFLQNSDATSPQHALKIMEQFVAMLQDDINGFSGKRSMADIERFLRTAATTPGVVRTFLSRAPGMAPFARDLVVGVTMTAHSAAEQARRGLEAADPATAAEEDTRRALAVAREVEAALRK